MRWPVGEHPTVRRERRVIPFARTRTDPLLADQPPDGPQEVQLLLDHPRERAQGPVRGLAFVAVVADDAPHRDPVRLLHPRLVILAVAAATGEPHAALAAPGHNRVVDELRAVVGVQRA